MLTPIDQIATKNHLQLVKAAVPYFQRKEQKLLSVLIKVMELQNILHFYSQNSCCISACEASESPPGLIDMLSEMRNYCEGSEQEMLDQWIQIAGAMELYTMFAQDDGS